MDTLVKELLTALDSKKPRDNKSRQRKKNGKPRIVVSNKPKVNFRKSPRPLVHGKKGAGDKKVDLVKQAVTLGTSLSGAASLSMSTVPLKKEVLHIEINPLVVFQYIHGVLSEAIRGIDTGFDTSYIYGVVKYYMNNLQAPNNSTLGVWPRKVLELSAHFRAREVGNYSYAPDWEPFFDGVSSLVSGMSANLLRGCTGLDVYTVGSIGSAVNSFLQPNSPDFLANQISEWQNNFSPSLDLVNISEIDSLDDGSASAFTWSSSTPLTSDQIIGPARPHFIVGSGATGSPLYYSPTVAQAFLETKITKHHLAVARFCTASNTYPWATEPAYPKQATRVPRYSTACSLSPRAYGAVGMKYGKVFFKQVPALTRLQSIIDKLEVLGSIINAQSGGIWSSLLGANDVIMYAQFIYRKFHSKFSSLNNGTLFVGRNFNATLTSVLSADGLELHVSDTLMGTLRLPEEISNHLGASDVYSDKELTIIPWVTYYDLAAVKTYLTYTGTPVVAAIPGVTAQRAFIAPAELYKRFKSLEQYMTGACNLRLQGVYGPSLLDTSILRGTIGEATYVTGVVSRRKIDDLFLSRILSKIASITYVSQDFDPTINPYTTSSKRWDRDSYDHQIPQRYKLDINGMVNPFDIADASKYDGFVRIGLTTNMSGNDGPDLPPNARPLVAPVREFTSTPDESKKAYYSYFLDRMVPRKGNYCGPSWTAGKDAQFERPVVGKDGKYLMPPTDLEDAICKKHDEAYTHALGDPKKIDQADEKMVKELSFLRSESGLTPYGLGALMAIAAKRRLPSFSGSVEHSEL